MSADRGVVIAVGAAALISRLAAQVLFGFYDHPESWEQDIVARNVALGSGYQLEYNGTTYQALVAPAFPLVLALMYVVFGISSLPVGVLQLAIGALLAIAVSLVALRSGLSRTTAALAGALVALHPGLVVYSAKLHPLEFDALLAALLVLVLVAIRRDPRTRWALALGVLGGIIVLERITFLPAVALVLVALAATNPRPGRVLRTALISGTIALAIVIPWLVRNEFALGTPTITTAGGLALWLGNNAIGTGGATLASGVPVIEVDTAVRDAIWGRPERDQEATLRGLALDYAAADPLRALRNVATRFLIFWWAGPQTGALYPATWTFAYLSYYVAVLALAAAGVVALVRARQGWLLLVIAALALSVSTAHALTYVEGRHRWAIEPEILVLTAAGLSAISASVGPRLVLRTRG